jgi:hypothetical protein
MVGSRPPNHRSAQPDRLDLRYRIDPTRPGSLGDHLDDSDLSHFGILLVGNLPAVVMPGRPQIVLEPEISNFQNNTIDIKIKGMPELIDNPFKAGSQFRPGSLPGGQKRKRVKNRSPYLDRFSGGRIKLFFFDQARLKLRELSK